jgi:energy-coupling factor transporter ATP-binding protein EcfA2
LRLLELLADELRTHAGGQLLLGRACYHSAQLARAQDALERAVEMAPTDAYAGGDCGQSGVRAAPERGAVLWDGVDMRELSVTELRERIGALFQDYMSYDLTASENIGLGDASALDDEDRIRTAAERAGISSVLERLRTRAGNTR